MGSHRAALSPAVSSLVVAAVLLVAAQIAPTASASWDGLAATNTGPATVYGEPGPTTNGKGTCSYGDNMADTTGLPFGTAPDSASDGGTGSKITFIALNDAQFDDSKACGTCLWFRGTGDGVGVESRRVSPEWQYGMVDNRCPECPKGAIDLARNYVVGDGIWDVEWFAVPCNVGDSSLHYSFVGSSPYFFLLVVSNGAVPVASVSMEVGGKSVELVRTTNNNYRYNGGYSFPMKVTVTPICGEPVTDTIKSAEGGSGSAQFSADGCGNKGSPVGGGSGGSSGSGKSSGGSSDSLDTEGSGTAARALVKEPTPSPEPKAVQQAPSASPPPPATKPPTADASAKERRGKPQPEDDASPPPAEAASPPPSQPPASPPPEPKAKAAAVTESPPPEKAAAPPASPPPEPTEVRLLDDKTESPPRHRDTAKDRLDVLLAASPPKAERKKKRADDEPPASPPAEPPTVPPAQPPPVESPPPPAVDPEQEVQSAVAKLFGGQLGRKAALPPYFQCGDSKGAYADAICGTEGFTCAKISGNYMQCRSDAGLPEALKPKAVAAARKYGRITKKGGKAVLPQYYQCGDRRGSYPDTTCKGSGFKCVAVTKWYMQCRNDDGSALVQGRRLLAGSRQQQ